MPRAAGRLLMQEVQALTRILVDPEPRSSPSWVAPTSASRIGDSRTINSGSNTCHRKRLIHADQI
jgi:hypothetical protein